MADEMDESRGKVEKNAIPGDQTAVVPPASSDGKRTVEMSSARNNEDTPVSGPGGTGTAESADDSQALDTPVLAASTATPQAEATPATARGSYPTPSEASATPFSHGEPSKAEVGPADSSPAALAGLDKPGLDLLYDVELDATLQFGSKEMLLRDVLELGPGDVVELDRHIAEPVDLVVGDRIVARGEVVVASGNFALRVTEVATPQMRLESIRCLF